MVELDRMTAAGFSDLVGRFVDGFQFLCSEIAKPYGNPILPTTLNHVVIGQARA